jgi:hypothetical protein
MAEPLSVPCIMVFLIRQCHQVSGSMSGVLQGREG